MNGVSVKSGLCVMEFSVKWHLCVRDTLWISVNRSLWNGFSEKGVLQNEVSENDISVEVSLWNGISVEWGVYGIESLWNEVTLQQNHYGVVSLMETLWNVISWNEVFVEWGL